MQIAHIQQRRFLGCLVLIWLILILTGLLLCFQGDVSEAYLNPVSGSDIGRVEVL